MAASTQHSKPGLGLIKKKPFVLPPMTIFSQTNKVLEKFRESAVPNGKSDSGWINFDLFITWFKIFLEGNSRIWYAGPISERTAEQVLTKLEKGAFLVRESFVPDSDYILSVNGGKDMRNYDIKVWPTDECVFNNYTFTNLPDAITFYTENRLGSVFLLEPTIPVVSGLVLSTVISPQIKAAPSPTQQPGPTALESPLTSDHTNSKTATEIVADEQKDIRPSSPKLVQEPTTHLNPQHGSQSSSSPAQPNIEIPHSQSPQIFTFENEGTSSGERSGEVKQSFIQPTKEIESVYIGTPDLTNDSQFDEPNTPESPHTSLSSTNTSSQSVSHSGNSSTTNTPTSQLKSPKVEQLELVQLPSIKQKKQALEQKLRGKEMGEQKSEEKKVPPPVPKRTVFRNNSVTKSKDPIKNTDDPQIEAADVKPKNTIGLISETVKSSVKNTPPPIPKRLLIPGYLQHLPEDDEAKSSQKIPPPTIPKRIVIPESLQTRPPPPPMSTHPGLTKKEEERQLLQQEQEKEKEKAPVNKPKKKLSFLRKKGKDKDKEKRKSNTKDAPVLLEESQGSVTGPVSAEGPHPRRLSGVLTPGMMPNYLNTSGGGAQILTMFEVITNKERQPENKKNEGSDAIITNSSKASKIKKPEEEVTRSKSIEVSTFKPIVNTTTSPLKHQNNEVPPTSPVSVANNGVTPTSPVSVANNGVTLTSPVSAANNGVTLTSPVSAASNGVTPTSPVSAASNGVTPTSPVSATNNGVFSTSPVSAANNGVTPTSPVSVANNGVTPISPVSAANNGVTLTSPVSVANNGVTPTPPVSAANNGVTPTSPVSVANNGVTPTSPVSAANNGVTPTSPVSVANNGVTPTSPVSVANNGVTPTSPVSAANIEVTHSPTNVENNGVTPPLVSAGTLPPSPTHIQHSPVISTPHSQVPVANTTSTYTGVNSKTQTTSITSATATTNTLPDYTAAVPPSSHDRENSSPVSSGVTTKKSVKKFHKTSSVYGVAMRTESRQRVSRQLGPRTQSLIDVVPGLASTLPRHLSTMAEETASTSQRKDKIDVSQMFPGVRVPVISTNLDRRNTTGSRPGAESSAKLDPSIGPMNTRRDKNSKKKGGIFSKN